MSPFRKILVPTDFSDCSSSAADVAVDMANAFEASLVLMHAYELPGYDYWGVLAAEAVEAVQGAARAALDEALASVRRRCPRAEAVLRFGVPWEQILAAVGETGADLVAMGTHGRCGLRHVLMGSVTERVVRTSPVPVLTVCRKPQRAGA